MGFWGLMPTLISGSKIFYTLTNLILNISALNSRVMKMHLSLKLIHDIGLTILRQGDILTLFF